MRVQLSPGTGSRIVWPENDLRFGASAAAVEAAPAWLAGHRCPAARAGPASWRGGARHVRSARVAGWTLSGKGRAKSIFRTQRGGEERPRGLAGGTAAEADGR